MTTRGKFCGLHSCVTNAQCACGRRTTPFEQAWAEFLRQGGERYSFDTVFAAHLRVGFVWSSPESFVLCRPVSHWWPATWLNDPSQVADDDSADAWWIYLLAGNISEAVGHLPRFLPWIGWDRRGIGRFRRTDLIVKHYVEHHL